MSEPLLEVRGLRVVFPAATGEAAAVDGLDLDVRRGELLALVGESGCGKSVAALALLRLVPPPGRIVAGSVRLLGEDLLRLDERTLRSRRGARIAMVFQEPLAALNPVLTIGAQVEEVLRQHMGMARPDARARALELLAEVGLEDPAQRARRFAHQLSGGERQRAMIAMAIACGPALLIADEPTTALDASVQARIVALVERLRRERSMGVLWITHDLALMAATAERTAVMYAGRIVEVGPTHELLTRPRHPYTAALLRALPQRSERGRPLQPIPGAVPALGARPPGCPFHPRCDLARPACSREAPGLAPAEQAPQVQVACPHHGEVRP